MNYYEATFLYYLKNQFQNAMYAILESDDDVCDPDEVLETVSQVQIFMGEIDSVISDPSIVLETSQDNTQVLVSVYIGGCYVVDIFEPCYPDTASASFVLHSRASTSESFSFVYEIGGIEWSEVLYVVFDELLDHFSQPEDFCESPTDSFSTFPEREIEGCALPVNREEGMSLFDQCICAMQPVQAI